MNFQTLNNQRKAVIIAALVGIISIFLPWITIKVFGMNSGQSINGFHGVGIVVFLGFVGAIIISILGDQTKALDKTLWLVTLLAGVLCLLFTIIFMLHGGSSLDGGMGLVDAGMGAGIWLALAAGLGVIICSWVFKNPTDTIKDGFDSLKKSINISTSAIGGTTNTSSSASNKIAELEKLVALKNQGHITEEEFQEMKSKL